MKAIRSTLLVFVMLALCALPMQNAQSGSTIPINPAAFMPWKIQNANETDAPDYISVGWGRTSTMPQSNYPLVSYTQDDGTNDIWFMRPAVTYVGDCGPDTAWNCSTLDLITEADLGTISQMQTYSFYNTFKVGWVYRDRTEDKNYVHTLELTQGLENAGEGDVLVMDFDKFDKPDSDYTQFGPASIAYDEFGNLHMVVVLQYGPSRLLVYAHKINTTPTTPCNDVAGTRYQCDIIVENSTGILHTPKLVLTADNQPRISYFDFETRSLMYAYPMGLAMFHPNCGPGNNTWRCVTIKTSTSDLNFYPDGKMPLMDMAIGPGYPQMLIEAWNSEGQARFVWAKFIGSDGNCGPDYVMTPTGVVLVNRWYCVWNVWDPDDDTPAYDDFALKVDSLDYAIIALNRLVSGGIKVGVLYYSERRGLPPGNWYFDRVDPGIYPTGRGVSMAIGTNDRLVLGYTMQEISDADLKIAIQDVFRSYAPIIRK